MQSYTHGLVAPTLGGGCAAAGPHSTSRPRSPWCGPRPTVGSADVVVVVGAERGDDAPSGSEACPFRTVRHALETTRESARRTASIVLRGGVHYLDAMRLGPRNSGLEIRSQDGDGPVWLSGATAVIASRLGRRWTWHPLPPSAIREFARTGQGP